MSELAGSGAPTLVPALAEAPAAVPKRIVLAWGLWDWGSASFNAVVTTFVFTVYLTTAEGFGGETVVSAQLGWALAGAGLLIALLAPVTGQRSDSSGRRKFWLGVNTYIVVAITAALFFVQPEQNYLWLGLLLVAAGNVFFEFAGVNYNAMLAQISTPKTLGRVSGFGWGMGYIGGIVLLLVVYFGFISPDVGLFGVTGDDGMDVRVSMLIAAAWFGIFALPVLFAVPEYKGVGARREKVGFFASYGRLAGDIRHLWRDSRTTVYFLFASAVFRDGLAGVFTFGGVLAAGSFGFSPGEVIIFAIAANVVAGISTITVGLLDDKVGPKPVIIVALIGIVIAGLAVFFLHDGGQTVFWIFGLALCLFVGPAQSASRSYLARVIPAGREGEVFGLYATTGRAVSFLAPTAFAICVTIGGAQYWGILGIIIVVLIGLALLIPVGRRLKH
ncbi:MFS transporter [Okibacterium fritillariae]|uniref:MFS transporter, UMF1 family n=1 Tax=Okibacterium fritillariae TaxID=123320 RepID=A0A1T5L049_9MICO|nr:MFS transporter [Okibacterium fritillariae]SKC69416.1 MFS transporter, UMF1 family [Okibacterium fritillariae]